MSLILRRKIGEGTPVVHRPTDIMDAFFSDWPTMLCRPFVVLPEGLDTIRSDEFTEDGTLVVRVEMAGIDPEKDIDISLDGDVLHIGAERREEEEVEDREYTRHDLRYASFHRDLPVPAGTTESEIRAIYRDGILEVRVPNAVESVPPPPAAKIPVSKG
jgi:HSP20 family protein